VRGRLPGSTAAACDGLLDLAAETHSERVQDAARALHRDAVVLVPLVARHLRFVRAETLGKLPLREPERDAQHRGHPDKREVRIYDYVDREVPMLSRCS
jgi:hypothetical protein